MSNVVLYLRYSSDKQTEQSIEGQDRVCTEFCRRNGMTIVGRYIDRALSASKDTDKRTEFNRMIADSAKERFTAVVVYKLDRFARNRYDSAIYKAKLKKNGVRVVSATEQISDTPEGIILESVLEGMAEFYSVELSQKVTRGMTETALKGHSCGGTMPLGYRVDKATKKLVVYEPEAAIVREAFDLYVSGVTLTEIVNLFNSRGLRTAKGRPFNKCSFATILRNEKYIGVYTYNDIRVEGGCPAIIDKETFERAQAIRAKHKHAPATAKAKVDYLLSQKLICGHCGALMVGSSGKSCTGATYHYYACPNQRRHTCEKSPVPKQVIEDRVAEHIVKILTPEFIDKLADMAIAQNQADIEADSIVPALYGELKVTETAITNIGKSLEALGPEPDLLARYKALKEQKSAILARIDEAQSKYIVLEKIHVVWWLSKFVDGDLNDDKYKRHLFDLLVNSVTVWDDPDGFKLTIAYNLTDKPTEIQIPSDSSYNQSCGSPLRSNPNFSQYALVWWEFLA